MKFAYLLAALTLAVPVAAGAAAPIPAPLGPVVAAASSHTPQAHELTEADLAPGLTAWCRSASDAAILPRGRCRCEGRHVLFEKGYGVADVKTGKPVDPARTLFRPGSIPSSSPGPR